LVWAIVPLSPSDSLLHSTHLQLGLGGNWFCLSLMILTCWTHCCQQWACWCLHYYFVRFIYKHYVHTFGAIKYMKEVWHFEVKGLSKYVKFNWANIWVGGTATITNECKASGWATLMGIHGNWLSHFQVGADWAGCLSLNQHSHQQKNRWIE